MWIASLIVVLELHTFQIVDRLSYGLKVLSMEKHDQRFELTIISLSEICVVSFPASDTLSAILTTNAISSDVMNDFKPLLVILGVPMFNYSLYVP